MARALGLAIPNDSIPFRRITEHGYIVIHVKPADVVRWAQGKKFSIPPELEVLFSEEPKSDSAVLPAKTSVLKTYPISDLVGRVCSQGELEEAIDSEELPVCVRLTRVPAYSESGETTHTAPGIYRLQPDDGKSLLPSAGQEGRRFALYSCYPEPNPDRLVFHFRAGTPAAPPPISYADLRVTHSDLVAWCEDKGKRPEWLFGKSPTQADPKEPVSQLPETASTKLPANSLYRIIGVLVMLLAIDPQSKKPLSKKDVATQNKVKQRYTHDTGNINRSAILSPDIS